MADVFISYAREDKKRAQQLANAVEAWGCSVWWDAEIPAGETWDQMIEHELATARCVLVLWSRTSISSAWVRAEASEALKRRVLIPVLIDAVEPPLAFRLIQTASLVGWRGEQGHPGLKELMGPIARLVTDGQGAPDKLREERNLHGQQDNPQRGEGGTPSAGSTRTRRARWPVVIAAGGTALAAGIGILALNGKEEPVPPNPTASATRENPELKSGSIRDENPVAAASDHDKDVLSTPALASETSSARTVSVPAGSSLLATQTPATQLEEPATPQLPPEQPKVDQNQGKNQDDENTRPNRSATGAKRPQPAKVREGGSRATQTVPTREASAPVVSVAPTAPPARNWPNSTTSTRTPAQNPLAEKWKPAEFKR
jgi:hypothetical protein